MTEPPLNPVAPKQPVRQRKTWEHVLVWSGIGLLLAVVFLEWTSGNGYQKTIAKLESAVGLGGVKKLAEADIQGQVSGFAFRGEETVEKSRAVTYHWPSLFKTYKLWLRLNPEGTVLLVETEGPSIDLPVAAPAMPTIRASLPKRGLPAGGEDVVALSTREVASSGFSLGSLSRELYRQSLLIAARDELGLPTRDESLGESVSESESPTSFPFELQVTIEDGNSDPPTLVFSAELGRINHNGKRFVWNAPRITVPRLQLLEPLAEQFEALSRGGLVDALRSAGYQKHSTGTALKDEAPPETVVVDRQLDMVSQYSAVRSLHAQIRRDAETAERLGGLVRAYGNLAQLTEFHWNPTSKVFKARSLLYAHRLLARFGKTRMTLAHRAYALAMAGLHASALEAIAAAQQAEGTDAPEWLPLIEAFCKHTPEVLDRTEGPLGELAAYLRMRMTDSAGEPRSALIAIQRVLTANPACSQALESLCETGTLGAKRLVTEQGHELMWPVVYSRVVAIPNLPDAARDVAADERGKGDPRAREPGDEYQARVQLIGHLSQAGSIGQDRAEPSWTVLADLLKELSFVQAWRTLDVRAYTLAVPVNQTRIELLPLVKSHRFAKFIESFADDQGTAAAEMAQQLKGFETWPIEWTAAPLMDAIYRRLGQSQYQTFAVVMEQHADPTYDDQVRKRLRSPEPFGANNLRTVSPHRPVSVAFIIDHEWEFAKKHVDEWERTCGDNPLFLKALAQKYQELHRPSDAERCLKKLTVVVPEPSSHLQLADHYRQQDDLKACQAALEDALDLPSLGLEDARIRVQLANLLMQRGDWEEARPHAEEAAQSYAAWALLTAARCAEGLEDWPAAETYHRAVAQRYENSSHNWYFWCVRLNRGDVIAARRHAEGHWAALTPPFTVDQLVQRAIGQIIAGEKSLAEQSFETAYKKSTDPYWAMRAALLADQLGEQDQRDTLFDSIATGGPKGERITREILIEMSRTGARQKSHQLGELINLLRGVLRGGNASRWNRNEFEMLVVNVEEGVNTTLYYFAGQFLAQHNQRELAEEYLQSAATSFRTDGNSCLLANLALRKLGIAAGQQRLNELPDELAPLAKLLQRAARRQSEGKLEEAEQLLIEALQQRPDFLPALIARGGLNEARENYPAAIADYREALKLDPEFSTAHNSLAWLLATCEQDDIRNGVAALEHAQRAFELRSFKSYISYGTLAAAHAECGQYEKATELQLKVLKLAPASDAQVVSRLELFRKGQPYHRPPNTTVTPAP